LEKKQNRIAVTCGDPAGIGPEVALKAALEHYDSDFQLVIIGRAKVLKELYPLLAQDIPIVKDLSDINKSPVILDVELSYPLPEIGKGTIETAKESMAYIDKALELWQKGLVRAIVTGPVHKGLIEESGLSFTGHTEYIADFIGEENPYMMMFSPLYRVVLATTHMPLSEVVNHVTEDSLLALIDCVDDSIGKIDGKKPKLAITGMDPHCGDNGAIGDFDQRVTASVVEKASQRGVDIDGPFAADTIFMPQKWSDYSCIIVYYHDQGLIPFKVLAFDSGVNVTLGLSIVRTSVDHGTAFDIAGKNIALHNSMVEAVKCAVSMSEGVV
jgi:4-hydroxythreonine-4-phosphate dehydrogenase